MDDAYVLHNDICQIIGNNGKVSIIPDEIFGPSLIVRIPGTDTITICSSNEYGLWDIIGTHPDRSHRTKQDILAIIKELFLKMEKEKILSELCNNIKNKIGPVCSTIIHENTIIVNWRDWPTVFIGPQYGRDSFLVEGELTGTCECGYEEMLDILDYL